MSCLVTFTADLPHATRTWYEYNIDIDSRIRCRRSIFTHHKRARAALESTLSASIIVSGILKHSSDLRVVEVFGLRFLDDGGQRFSSICFHTPSLLDTSPGWFQPYVLAGIQCDDCPSVVCATHMENFKFITWQACAFCYLLR